MGPAIGLVTKYWPETRVGSGKALVQVVDWFGVVCRVKADKRLVQEMTMFVSIWVIERRAGTVVIVRLQPPEIAPASGLASSTMKRLQAPLGFVPLKTPK